MNIEDSKKLAKQGIEALEKIYRPVPEGFSKVATSRIDEGMLTDFFTDVMHLLGHGETEWIFVKAGEHWDEERAK